MYFLWTKKIFWILAKKYGEIKNKLHDVIKQVKQKHPAV